MTYSELMGTPISVFWFLSSTMERIRAEEDQRQFRVANNAQGGEGAARYLESLQESVGKTFVVDEAAVALNAKRDEKGYETLKQLAKQK